ncbi:MAG TPA: VWA domain-containing protein [Vicinamibacterales bacterium]|nr:VWA domain-containing protein [Vicinamibacterales bacterium]
MLCYVLCAPGPARAQDQPPRFTTGVEVTSLDVSVVDGSGKPITDLKPADFTVRIDGNSRRVTTAEWVPLAKPAGDAPAVPVPDGFSTNENAVGGRLIVIVVDEPNIRVGGAMAIAKAANGFIDRLSTSDRIAVASLGTGGPATVFTADRARVKAAIGRMVGQKHAGRDGGILEYNVSLTEAMAIDRGDSMTLQMVRDRECDPAIVGREPYAQMICRTNVELQAKTQALDSKMEGDQTIVGLRALFTGLRSIEGPKTMILISEGFVLSDQALTIELGALAAAARTSIYALHLDKPLFDATTLKPPVDVFGDRETQSAGLETLAGAARGALFNVMGTGTALFERIEAELSGYYLLGVESDPKDRDGKPHPIRVDVPRRGAIVRSRRQILNTPADARVGRAPHQAVANALASPLLLSALPLRVASFALLGPERDKVQLLIHADIGTDYSSSKVLSLAYLITDKDGRIIENRAFDARLLPVMSGVPSALQYSAGASLPAGDYILKLAVIEGERVGSIEHPLKAVLPQAPGDLTFSELMVGGPIEVGEILQPTIGYQVSFGTVHGYVEAYGSATGELSVEYEVATDANAPALVDVDVPPHAARDGRVIFTRVIPVHQIPPGKYLLRAVFSRVGRSVKTLTRAFEIAAPKVLMTSADGVGPAAAMDTGLFLPIEEGSMAPSFASSSAVDKETLEPFRERVDASVKAPFDQGVVFLTAGDFAKAETAFKKAIQPEVDSTAALTYLAASFAAAGHDIEAAGAWQTALVDGTDYPQIYDWLGGALLRNHAFGEARSIYEEAAAKWPVDPRFTRPLAMLYATFGSGREAVRTLERYLAARPDDTAACGLGVQWIYMVHAAGAYVHNRTDDVKLAHTFAEKYAGGPQAALVKQWVEYLDNEKRP